MLTHLIAGKPSLVCGTFELGSKVPSAFLNENKRWGGVKPPTRRAI